MKIFGKCLLHVCVWSTAAWCVWWGGVAFTIKFLYPIMP
jgi:hypothetical protein